MKRLAACLLLALVAVSHINCAIQASPGQSPSGKSGIITGADQTEKYLPYLKGKRIALVANQSSIIGGTSSVDSLLSLGVNIVKVFGPEHGFRGNASNGAVVGDEKDAKQVSLSFHYTAEMKSRQKNNWLMSTSSSLTSRMWAAVTTPILIRWNTSCRPARKTTRNCSYWTGPIPTDMWSMGP